MFPFCPPPSFTSWMLLCRILWASILMAKMTAPTSSCRRRYIFFTDTCVSVGRCIPHASCSLLPSRLICVLWTSTITLSSFRRICPSFPTSWSSFRRSRRCSCLLACLQKGALAPARASPSTAASDPSTWSLTSGTATWPHPSTPTC